ncbi:Natural cytotoxicity triggering receptor 1 [Tupaia chinensis]|uniref:Natural cytotoxicity triggering receptor 1 n=1 Tax=Tupaia chinensis TaxID=246437 RepID=L9KQI5_TUPCH|nr:Natural cytotoxicity triggering receptor 1 [Tupaia chinensis]
MHRIFPTPVISASPSSLIPWNGSVKILCQGTPESYLYQLVILGNASYKEVEKRLGIQKEAEFVIKHMDTTTAGRLQCRYMKQYRWSEYSEALELVVTGLFDKPLLSAEQGVVRLGAKIYLRCGSAHVPFDSFSLAKDGEASLPPPQHRGPQGSFTLGPVNRSFSGNYRCYGWHSGSPYVWSAPSNALELVVTALAALLCLGLCLSRRISTQTQTLSKPTIWAKPDFMVPKGKPVAIWCRGAPKAAEFQLYFEGSLSAVERPRTPGPLNQVKFLISAMSSQTAGQYSCSYWTGELWSEPSHTLDLVVTGMYEDEDDVPTLSVLPGPEVTSGDSVTFCCHLQTATSTFFLVKEGRPSHVQKKHGTTRAEFPVGLVTTAHQGTYRCFGSYNNHAWSLPSKPVKLVVTAGLEGPRLSEPAGAAAWCCGQRPGLCLREAGSALPVGGLVLQGQLEARMWGGPTWHQEPEPEPEG